MTVRTNFIKDAQVKGEGEKTTKIFNSNISLLSKYIEKSHRWSRMKKSAKKGFYFEFTRLNNTDL